LLGICMEPLCIVTDYYKNGSLLNYLESHGKELNNKQLMKILQGIAAGMSHLHVEKVIHRDLASRNILLSEILDPAVADFGFARAVAKQEDVGMTRTEHGPLRWMAVESLQSQAYSTKSDVWAFAVTAWETMMRGALPYGDLDTVPAGIAVVSGLRLKPPPNCPKSLCTLFSQCWSVNPDDRPTMQQVFERLEQIEPEVKA